MLVLSDFDTSVKKALSEIEPRWLKYEGLVITGTHSPRSLNIEKTLELIRKAREDATPFLGICFGYQLAAIEYARNVLGIKDATSEEFGQGTLVVKKRPALKVGLYEGESWWSYYDVDPSIVARWQAPSWFTCVPFHPEYNSMIGKPHPVLVKFINDCKKHG